MQSEKMQETSMKRALLKLYDSALIEAK